MNLNVNPGKNSKVDLGARQSFVGMLYCWIFRDNYTAVTEGRKHYSYEKKPASSDKQIYELIGGCL